ncbi:MAG TPA: transcription termination factor NusA [Bdellovibrionota bacterium]|nr:transcription termination factor NusA [Bdellovibrionota bacterium]
MTQSQSQGMFKGLNREIEQLCRDKGIKKEVIIEAVQSAFLSAAKKKFGLEKEIEAHFNEKDEEIELFEFRTVVEKVGDPLKEVSFEDARRHDAECQMGDVIGVKMDSKELGRIAAQAAKQVIIQKIRDAETEIIHGEYKDRKGTLIAGIVRRFEKGSIMIDLGRTEAVLPASEQVPREHYRQGDRIQTYVVDVVKTSRGAEIVVSRAHPGLLMKLFEMEVPEIYEGIVRIEAAAREPGGRSKIAVSSRDSDVDPVGACVGMKGSRVQAVVQELRGEKIDIVAFHPDPARYVCNAIAPAEVSRVILDDKNRTMELIVADDQLSLAIGKKGQNVRLAARLTGWRIDIHSETKVKEMAEEGRRKLTQIEGLGDNLAELLYNQGVTTPESLIGHDTNQIAQITGLEPQKIEDLKVAAATWLANQKQAAADAALAASAAAAAAANAEVAAPEPALPMSDGEKEILKLKGVGPKTMEALKKGGFGSVADLAKADAAAVAEKSGLGEKKAAELIESAQQHLSGGSGASPSA